MLQRVTTKICRRLWGGVTSLQLWFRQVCMWVARREHVRIAHFADQTPLNFFVPNMSVLSRALSVHKKEPMTQAWIKSFAADEIFWDVGANIGQFSLLAAANGVRVVAFEPLSSNSFVLQQNILANLSLQGDIVPLQIPLTDVSGVNQMYLPAHHYGYSGVSFGRDVDQHRNSLQGTRTVSMLGMAAKDVLTLLGGERVAPQHIKVDVDGLEYEILQGMEDILRRKSTLSVLVEIEYTEPEKAEQITTLLNNAGLFDSDLEREPTIPSDEIHTSYNHIFRRKSG